MNTAPQNNKTTPILEMRSEELARARKEYDAYHTIAKEKGELASALGKTYAELSNTLRRLVRRRDNLNQELRDDRKELKDLESSLQIAQFNYNQAEELAKQTRREVIKQRQDIKAFIPDYESARSEYENIERKLEASIQRLKAAEKAYDAAGGKLSREEVFNERKQDYGLTNPWLSGSFYLFVAVVVSTVFCLLAYVLSIPWYVVVLGIVLLFVVIGLFQLRNDRNLSEDGFTRILIEVLQQLTLLKPDSQKINLPEIIPADKQLDEKGDDNPEVASTQTGTG